MHTRRQGESRRFATLPGYNPWPDEEVLEQIPLVRATAETPAPIFPRAWGYQKENGWTIDSQLLLAIHDEIRGEEFATSQEGVELVLLAYERVQQQRATEKTNDIPPDRLVAWNCGYCEQLNSGWSSECGRCGQPRSSSGSTPPRNAELCVHCGCPPSGCACRGLSNF